MPQKELLKTIDPILGKLLVGCLPAPPRCQIYSPASFLFIRPGGIGDAVLLLPALRALRTAYPCCSIDILAEKRNAAAFRFSPDVRRVFKYDSLSGLAKTMKGRYDVEIDTEQWHRLSAVVARLVHARVRIGFATNDRKRLFTHPVSYDYTRYEAETFFRLLEPLGIPAPCRIEKPFLEVPLTAEQDAVKLLAPLAGRSFVSVFTGASMPAKQWGEERFRELIAQLGAWGLSVVLVGGREDCPTGARLSMVPHVLNLTGRSPLAVSAAILARGLVLVSGDSGLLHIAAGLGVPTVSLFGPSDPGKWAPRGPYHLHLQANHSCGPCSRYGTIPSCDQLCLSTVNVAQVVAAVESILSKSTGKSPDHLPNESFTVMGD